MRILLLFLALNCSAAREARFSLHPLTKQTLVEAIPDLASSIVPIESITADLPPFLIERKDSLLSAHELINGMLQLKNLLLVSTPMKISYLPHASIIVAISPSETEYAILPKILHGRNQAGRFDLIHNLAQRLGRRSVAEILRALEER